MYIACVRKTAMVEHFQFVWFLCYFPPKPSIQRIAEATEDIFNFRWMPDPKWENLYFIVCGKNYYNGHWGCIFKIMESQIKKYYQNLIYGWQMLPEAYQKFTRRETLPTSLLTNSNEQWNKQGVQKLTEKVLPCLQYSAIFITVSPNWFLGMVLGPWWFVNCALRNCEFIKAKILLRTVPQFWSFKLEGFNA